MSSSGLLATSKGKGPLTVVHGAPRPCLVWPSVEALGGPQCGLCASGRQESWGRGAPEVTSAPRDLGGSYLLKCSLSAKWEPSHYPPSWQRELWEGREKSQDKSGHIAHFWARQSTNPKTVRGVKEIRHLLSVEQSLEASVKSQHSPAGEGEATKRIRVALLMS